MGLIRGLVTLPLMPVQGVVKLAELIQEQAERELYDPVRIQQRLEDVAEACEAGVISQEDAAEAEEELIGLPMSRRPGAPRGPFTGGYE